MKALSRIDSPEKQLMKMVSKWWHASPRATALFPTLWFRPLHTGRGWALVRWGLSYNSIPSTSAELRDKHVTTQLQPLKYEKDSLDTKKGRGILPHLRCCCVRSSLELLRTLCGQEETKVKMKIIMLRMPSSAEQKDRMYPAPLKKIFFLIYLFTCTRSCLQHMRFCKIS